MQRPSNSPQTWLVSPTRLVAFTGHFFFGIPTQIFSTLQTSLIDLNDGSLSFFTGPLKKFRYRDSFEIKKLGAALLQLLFWVAGIAALLLAKLFWVPDYLFQRGLVPLLGAFEALFRQHLVDIKEEDSSKKLFS